MTAKAPYGSVVLEHFKRPRNQRALDRVSASHDGFNRLCGDRVRIELEVADDTIRAAAFTANACAICTAAAGVGHQSGSARDSAGSGKLRGSSGSGEAAV